MQHEERPYKSHKNTRILLYTDFLRKAIEKNKNQNKSFKIDDYVLIHKV